MSDTFISIIPANVTTEQVTELSKRAIDWLMEKKFISSEKINCVMGQRGGYAPGPNYKRIISDETFELLALKINGLEVVEERHVFDNGQNGIDEVNCPHCGANNIEAKWGEAIDSWHSGENGKLMCNQCNRESSITAYHFRPTWGFGEFGLVFWNWPGLKTDFLNDLKVILDSDIKIVYGRL